MTDRFAYLKLRLARGPAARAALVAALETGGLTGGRTLGLFTAQLGWEASEAVILARANGEGPVTLSDGALAQSLETVSMTPTARPLSGAMLRPGGVWVHRRFDVKASDVEPFVALSVSAWPDFEARFDAQIFGLFRLDAPPGAEEASLLLITRYGDHGVWEASRDPTTEAMQTFLRRAALTLRTQAASTLLTMAG